MKKAIYALSADPVHNGHIDVIERAAKRYKLTVAVGNNPEKKYIFSLNERLSMLKKAVEHIKNVDVVSFRGLLVDYAYENNIPVMIKAIRNKDDIKMDR